MPSNLLVTVRHSLCVLVLFVASSGCIGDGAPPGTSCENACATAYPNVPECFAATWDADTCTCSLVALGVDAPCSDGNACTLEDRCSATDQCVGQLVDLDTFCDDGDDCTEDNCDQNVGCVHDLVDEGSACDDGNSCTISSSCSARGACNWTNQYVCGLCAEDADCAEANLQQDACNGRLQCVRGYCEIDPTTVPTCDSPRLDPCQVPACADGTCASTDLPDGTACSDLSSCTKGDTCQEGTCTGAAVAVAACQCSSDEDCVDFDDGDRCNGTFKCGAAGVCVFDFQSIVVCDASNDNACSTNTCDPTIGEGDPCVMRVLEDGTNCADGDRCMPDKTCQDGACVGTPLDCSELTEGCLVGSCDRIQGCVRHIAEPGLACTPSEPCASGGECNDEGDCIATNIGCDDDDPCTTDVCDELTGECQFIGPDRPTCDALGACAGGVPLRCELGEYRCDYAAVAGWSAVEKCDGKDDDCDGETDDACIAGEACVEGGLLGAWSGTMQACAGTTTVAAAECGTGWHVCSYATMVDALAGDNPPPGFYISASIKFDPATGYSVIDHNSECFEFNGVCTSAREVQAMTWDGVFGATVAYAAEAWGCDNGLPASTCDTVRFAGVMCCADECDSNDDCADGSPCTTDTCVNGRCENAPGTVVSCASVGVCAGLQPTCAPDGTLSCEYDGVAGWESIESTCDGLDNDCDGATDATDGDFLVAGELCELGVGVCAGATKRAGACIEGAWSLCGPDDYSASSAFYEDAFEGLCDGRDNNCDGATDAGFVWSGRVIGQSCDGVGECGSGTVECAPTSVGATCSTNPNGSASGASREACNGKDDDCDGETDELDDLDPDDAPCGVAGVCAGLPIARCSDGDWVCDTQGLPDFGSELCDGLDNDCDGDTDEGFGAHGDLVGAACGPSDCPNGVVICMPDKLSAECSSDIDPHYEVCDGIDNDCAAGTDEGIVYDDPLFGERELGEGCSGRGECGAGVVECGGDGRATCSSLGGSTSEVAPEVCNGLDDDCDGHVDEGHRWNGIALGAACTAPGECGAGVVQCAGDGSRAICSTLNGASAETCNGKDDDCDGAVDDNVVPGPDDCPHEGVCRPEMLDAICTTNGWRCEYDTNPYYQGGNELGRCDRLDNDCDGATDEDFPDLGAACDGPDLDLCARGTTVCDPTDATRTTCVGDHAAAEVCNGEDDDCDGQTDEIGAAGCTVFYEDRDDDQYGTVTRCACAPAGDFTATAGGDCNDAAAAINPGAPELCNGQDDDCDGKTDAADAADLIVDDVTPCELQAGVCAGTNKNASRCVGGQWEDCELADYVARNPAFQAKETRCDGLDNDCNGASDGGDANIAANPPLCELQQGLCSGAVKPLSSCTAGGWAACSGSVYVAHAPAYEANVELSCDGKDNECDGLVDDDFTFAGKKVGQSCDGTGACGLGSVECNVAKTGATCSTNPGASQHQDVAETCNAVDDDCDGATDDNLELQQSPCRQVGVCTPEEVVAACTDGTWSCDYSDVDDYEPNTEASCDDQDNDCDGQTDEDMTLTAGGQTLRKGDVCGSGSCSGVVVCNAQTPSPSDLTCSSESNGGEICDRLDNDCDAQTDEGLTWTPIGGAPIAVGAACDGYGACGPGVVECAQSLNAVCSTNPDGSDREDTVETCNGLDDDCDRTVDDGFSYSGVPVGQPCDGIGECGSGVVECTGATSSTCSSNPDGSATTAVDELCNGLDDDCDGMTDEDLTVVDSPCLQAGVCAGTVVATCQGASGWKCDYAGVPHYNAADEVGYCDGLDNDCDTKVDEDYPQLGQPCDLANDPDQCALGRWTCPAPSVDDGTVIGDPTGPTGVPMCVGDTPSPEVCGGGDEDCDGTANEEGAQGCSVYFLDGDQDGYGKEGFQKCLCAPGAVPFYTALPRPRFDCNDADVNINPDRPEVCNNTDDNCNGQTDEGGPTGCTYYFYDFDNDDWGVSTNTMCFCFDHQAQATLWSTQAPGDCNDNAADANPSATETCDGIDNDCDQLTDDADKAPVDGCTTYFYDNDLDQYGVTSNTQCRCLAGDKYTTTASGDFCDTDLRTRPNQTEWYRFRNNCNNYDYNCSGQAELEYPAFGGCDCGIIANLCTRACTYQPGWRRTSVQGTAPVPSCGEEAFFVDACNASCEPIASARQQRCH